MGNPDEKKLILWFDEIGIEDVPIVGGKNASLGEMHQKLTSRGVAVPNGYAITAYAYQYLLKEAGVEQAIRDALDGLDTHDMRNLQERGEKVRNIIRTAEFPDDLRAAIIEAYRKMEEEYGKDVDVAVRSSATAEDLPDASFAGQQETYLNIRGPEALIDACKRCFASLFTNRAISYRHDKGFGQFDVYLSIVVQKMARSDSASSGVMFSIDTESGFEDAVFITAAWGLGENVVQDARRVLRVQADPEAGEAAHRLQEGRLQGNQDDLQRRLVRVRRRAGEEYRNHPRGAQRLCNQRR
jgi:pyruvate, water dikinase